MSKVDFNFAVDVEFEIDDEYLTEELMDNYERYFHDISNDSDFALLETRKEKHIANIAWYLMRGETHFIEGYGKLDSFIKSEKTTLIDVEKGD